VSFLVPAVAVILLVSAPAAGAQQASDPRVEGLVRAGQVRVAVFPPQYTKDETTRELKGWPVELGGALADKLKIKSVTIEYRGPREAIEGLKSGACDVAFLPIEPSWAAEVAFSSPFMQIDFTLLVPAMSPIRSLEDMDRAGVRVSAVSKHASTLALSRVLKHAALASAESPEAAFEFLRTGQADAFASVRPALLEFSARLPGSAVLEQRYGANFLTVAVAKIEAGWLNYLNEFIEEAKASGVIQRAVDHAGWRGVQVVPLGFSIPIGR
jgi:polar amino acid transport system substrate-binding protein